MNSFQKRWLELSLICTSIVLGQAACSNNGVSEPVPPPPVIPAPGTASPTPAPSPSPSASPSSSPSSGFAWNQVSEQTECETGTPNSCLGFYGFTVENDGTYEIGPSPSGFVLHGTLNASEFAMINRDATQLSTETLGSDYTCESGQFTPGVQDNVGVLFPGESTGTVVYQQELATQGSNCFLGAGPNALQLHTDMHALLTELYTLPFPPSASPSPSPSPSESISPSPSPSPSASTISGTPIQNGTWGGNHVRLTETSTSAKFTFECASGQIQGPITVNASGQFSATGIYTLRGGIQIQGVSQQFPATFSGSVEDGTMDLTVAYTDGAGHHQRTQYQLDLGDNGILSQLCIE